MSYVRAEALVTTDWLAAHMRDANVALIDASWHMPATKRDAAGEFAEAHIPGARYFDIDKIADTGVNLPHMLPTESVFARSVELLGIGSNKHVVCYDVNGGMGAAMRAWWMFRTFGHSHVSVLAGGFGKWKAEGRAVESGTPAPQRSSFHARLDPDLVRTLEQVRINVGNGREQLVDVRSAGRFNGTEAEPRPGLRAGHIPGSINLPFGPFFDPANHMVPRGADEIAKTIDAAGIDRERPIVASCGSGVTACVLAFMLHLIGEEAAVYDGSWTEWGGRADTPVETS